MCSGFSDDKALILCLHSTIAPKEQKLAFNPPPANKRKIVLSTPIAETSITINDVSVVINCGKMKEKSFDAEAGVSTLQSRWISKANQTQRAGRAGRCQEGIAFHIYTKFEAQELADFIQPEICRISLDEICLQVNLKLAFDHSFNFFRLVFVWRIMMSRCRFGHFCKRLPIRRRMKRSRRPSHC